jgi:hypothetical protein
LPWERLSGDLAVCGGFAGHSLERLRKTNKVLFQFDKFLLDTDRRELRGGDGGVVHVEPQVFDLLLPSLRTPTGSSARMS